MFTNFFYKKYDVEEKHNHESECVENFPNKTLCMKVCGSVMQCVLQCAGSVLAVCCSVL